MRWHELKAPIALATGLADTTLHLLVGAGMFTICVYIFRRRRHPLSAAWIVVLVAEFLNEVGDAADAVAIGKAIPWQNSIKDILVTIVGPIVLTISILFVAKWQRRNDR